MTNLDNFNQFNSF